MAKRSFVVVAALVGSGVLNPSVKTVDRVVSGDQGVLSHKRSTGVVMRALIVLVCACLTASPCFAEDKFFNSNGVRIRYVDEGSGEAVILLHGFAGNIDRWRVDTQILPALRADYRVIAFDSRGNGMSDKPHDPHAYGIEMARDAIRLLDHLKIPKAHFVGFSFGGNVVAKLLTLSPERFLTATIGGSAGARAEDPKGIEEYADQISRGDFRGLISRTASTGGPPPSEDMIRARSKEIAAVADVAALAAMVRGRPALAVTESELARANVPTLAIVGTLDANYKAVRELKNVMPSLHVVVIEGAAHGPTLRHASFLTALREFLLSNPGRVTRK